MSVVSFERYEFVPRFLSLAIANVISNIMTPLASLISIFFLGHLEEINHLAGVAFAGNLLSFIFFTLSFLRMGTTGITAQAVGKDDREALLLVLCRNGLIAIVLGLSLILLRGPLSQIGFAIIGIAPEVKASAQTYFNTAILAAPASLLNFVLLGWFLGQEKKGFIILLSIIVNFVKILFDYLLIFQWNYASWGAGVSFASSQYLLLLAGVILLTREIMWTELSLIVDSVRDISALKSSLAFNTNILISNFLIILTALIFNYESIQLGTEAYTQNSLLIQVINLSIFIVSGIGFCTETLVGNFKGEGSTHKLFPLALVSLGSGLLVAFFIGGACALFPSAVFGLLTDHTELTETIEAYIPWLCIVLIFDAVSFVLDAHFLGLAEGQILRNASLWAMLVYMPVAIVAFQSANNQIIWLSMALFLLVRSLGLGIKLSQRFHDLQEKNDSLILSE